MDRPSLLDLLADADRRLVRAVDGLDGNDWTAPSLLPGWSRAHVVAHLALNAEAVAAVVDGVRAGAPGPMYPSRDRRDADIVALAAEPPSVLRDRLLAGTTRVGEAVAAVPDDAAAVSVERYADGPTFLAGGVGGMRLREVEIHHADLDVGYTAADWSAELAAHVLDARAAAHDGPAFVVHGTDVGRQWRFGSDGGGATVSGPVRALAWWATGRGDGDGLTSDDGRVPRITAW